ncbi:GH36-type glycosyl hydrolase domain-containing protein [Treponema peruense]|uniref:N,N'-diacetylchitobiose phosphorylase n=1 Tax=Treponema peruense TaxID=2787628 RepID=A0A7T3RCJ9_9SPIR|nr:N,N'-diacetylchitobiose phosphorylase [Treponema peruense]QQA00515.1 N,N'-diacetylchitobiose phosphorylase [Treponema peruense]
MQYGYFDDEAKEYVVTRPDTPSSWSNYLGSTEYGAVITNNAGGYGFYKSGAQGRFMRLRFNSVPMDQPGRYFYLRDMQSGDYWSASWQPVGKPLDSYKSECRHGTAYTKITSEYSGIESETKYYVPLGQTFEYWRLKLTNKSSSPRKIRAFTYCEFTNQWNTTQDQVNLQYSIFIVKGQKTSPNMIQVISHENLYEQHKKNPAVTDYMSEWMALAGSPVTGFDTSRQSFIGTYGSYKEPAAVVEGCCYNSEAFGDNACGTLQTDIELAPGESKEILVMLGIGAAEEEGKKALAEFGTIERADLEFDKLVKNWHEKLGSFKAVTPDEDINHTVNVWGLYNCLITFAWSRAASLVYNGERDGLGYRDSVQDILGVSAAIPEQAEERLVRLLSGQFSNGGALPVIGKDFVPGKQKMIDAGEFRSDDCQWFFNAVPCFVAETGKLDFYNRIVPYADQGEATVYGHLKQALLFNLERMGADGLPCGLLADWNDCLKLGYHGESLFVAFQLRLGLTTYADISERLNKSEEAAWALSEREKLDANIQKKCWDGKWFVWAIAEDGTVYGTHSIDEGQIYFNTQVWSVLSGAATPEQQKLCLESVKEKLATPYGLMLCAPPFVHADREIMSSVVFLPGIKENAGIFNHTQGWGVIAEIMNGNGDRAYEYCKAALPAAYNDRAEVRQSEPYVIGQTTYSTYSKRPGNTRVSWLSGAATWNYYSITQYMLGIRPQYDGLLVDPCIKHDWDSFSVERRWRNMNISIEVKNPSRVCRGIESLEVDGKKLDSVLVPVDLLHDGSRIIAVMGKNALPVRNQRM